MQIPNISINVEKAWFSFEGDPEKPAEYPKVHWNHALILISKMQPKKGRKKIEDWRIGQWSNLFSVYRSHPVA